MNRTGNRTASKQAFLFAEREPGEGLARFLQESEMLFVKKLSLNDRDWARDPSKHQAGVYVPQQERDAGFFPRLVTKERNNQKQREIRESFFDISWPDVDERKRARLVHYTSKGQETHLTRLPKSAFRELAPASLLVIGRSGNKSYEAMTLDSESLDYETLSDILKLSPDFVSGIYGTSSVWAAIKAESLAFIDEVLKAYFEGTIANLAARYSCLPATTDLAATARARYMELHGLASLNPFDMSKPGDAIRTISRGIEYEIFKDLQLRSRAIELVRLVVGDNLDRKTPENILRSIIIEFPKVDALLLSAAQQRKSRAGFSFEHHLEAMLADGAIPFEKQVVIEAKKRPDFILPARAVYEDDKRMRKEAFVLSAKTTLRERWKQVRQEMKNCDLYLATLDENIAGNAIEDMASQGIVLVVPESLKESRMTEYHKYDSVITFKSFFNAEIRAVRWPLWSRRGLIG